MANSEPILRSARWGILIAAFLVSAALAVSSRLGYVSARDSVMDMARGQAAALFEGLAGRFQGLGHPPTSADLDGALEALSASGLTYVGLRGRARLSAGSPVGNEDVGVLPRRGGIELRRVGERMRAVVRRPGPRRPRPGSRPPPRRAPRGGHFTVIEFDPGPASELVSRAYVSMVTSWIGAVVLIASAFAAFFWLRRREGDAHRRSRERHLATLGEMSAVLAHEIRNPLASLKGHAQLLAEQTEGEPKTHKKAVRVVGEAVRLESLTNDLLDFVRTGEIHAVESNPVDVVAQAASQLGSSEIAIDSKDAPPSFQLDPDRMQQAIFNLLDNASQAGSDVVDVRVSIERGRLIVVVRDRGPGIAAGSEKTIFEPFHTTRTRGTGLGLAVARRIVELHGGTIECDNHPDGGARFRVDVPSR